MMKHSMMTKCIFYSLPSLSHDYALFSYIHYSCFSPLRLLFFNALQSNPACTIDEGRKKYFSPPLSLSIHPPKQLYSYTILGVNILTYDCKLNLCIVIFSGKNFNLIAIAADTKSMGTHSICLALFGHKRYAHRI